MYQLQASFYVAYVEGSYLQSECQQIKSPQRCFGLSSVDSPTQKSSSNCLVENTFWLYNEEWTDSTWCHLLYEAPLWSLYFNIMVINNIPILLCDVSRKLAAAVMQGGRAFNYA